MSAVERGRIHIEAKERSVDEVRKDVEAASIEADKILADQVELDMQLKGVAATIKLEHETLARKQKEKEVALREYRHMEHALKLVQDSLMSYRNQVEQLQRTRSQVSQQLAAQHAALEEARKDLDISMASFLKEEDVGKEAIGQFMISSKEVELLKAEVDALKNEEAARMRIIFELSAHRDRVARMTSLKLEQVKSIDTQAILKDMEVHDLKRTRKESVNRMRDFEKLYELVKNQRNKFVTLIQAATQNITEMKDKLKILANELDILRSESMDRDKKMSLNHSALSASITTRDSLRSELDRLARVYREKEEEMDKAIAEVAKLNGIISATERDMLKLRKQYEIAVESRNHTGVMLIDRNDELCILYEKANIQEEVIRAGEQEQVRREDEARLLSLEVGHLQRSIEVTKRLVPQVPLLDEDVARLQKSLLQARRESEALSLALENPQNQSRWRFLDGRIPDREELAAKIQQLEERLNDKKETLLEKELILQEINALSDKLRAQATEGRGDALEIAKTLNEYQGKLASVTRKMMATVSELSMYQATALQLSQDKAILDAEVSSARERLDEGLPPTEEAEREWWRQEREQATMEELAQRRAEEEAMGDEVQSAADARPNAYIPEDIGIPKPYGQFTPFKPTELGATMRHIRKPQPREIII